LGKNKKMKILFPAKRGEIANLYPVACHRDNAQRLLQSKYLLLEIKSGWIRIVLKDEKKVLDELSFLEERNLSEKLLPTIEQLLRKNKLQPQDIQDFQVTSDLGENYTTFRLAKTVAEAFKFAVKEK